MEHILPAYNDPLFSIFLIIVSGLVIALASYGRGVYKQQKEQGNLLKFLDKFDGNEYVLDTHSMPYESHMLKPLTLLAKAFENSGEYHKAISIYLYLIKNTTEDEDIGSIELLEQLGNTYLHAGFLERAKSIYIDILRKHPRNTEVLYSLGIVYETMHEYEKAKELIGPLEILGEETHALKEFLNFSHIIYTKNNDSKETVSALTQSLKEEPKLYRQVIAALLKLDTKIAWEMIDPERIREIIDILWFLPNSQLDLDIITANRRLNILYYAKGYLQEPSGEAEKSGIFALDMLTSAKQQGFDDGELHFSYLCKKCKQIFPVSFDRCPNCTAIYSIEVKENIGKTKTKTNYSLL